MKTEAAAAGPISEHALDQIFRNARTHSAWLPKSVPLAVLREVYELAKLGPTSANASPARFVSRGGFERGNAGSSSRPASPSGVV